MKFFRESINANDYMIATYEITSRTDLRDASWNLAIGQSVGNPSVRNSWETEALFENHSCIILHNEQDLVGIKVGTVRVAFPAANTNVVEDGISHILCQLMGGHVDIDIVERCRLVAVDLPDCMSKHFLGPKYGISGMRSYTGQYNKPLLGSIIKPKVGISKDTLLDITKSLVDGGADFIKEDEIMASPLTCPLTERVPLISNWLAQSRRKVVYCFCINGDPHTSLDKATFVADNGGNGVHINVFAGWGVYNSLRRLDRDLFIHVQKSGDRLMTHKGNPYSISWAVMCKLIGLMGADTIQTGMVGGYSNDDPVEIMQCLDILRNANLLPALSCGFHPGLVGKITEMVGVDYLANVGGAIHGHEGGTGSGARAMRQAIDKTHGSEYHQAISKWGLIK